MSKQTFFIIFLAIGSLCGVFALLLFAISIPRKELLSIENVDYIYDKLSFHMFFLEAILVIVGLAAAVLGFIGYQSIKEEAVKQAVKQAVNQAVGKAKDEAEAYLKGLPKQPDIPIKSPHNGSNEPKLEDRKEGE